MDARLYGVYEAGTGREQLRQYGNGLLILIAFMALSELCHNVMNAVTLPWFKSPEGLGVQAYTWMGVFVVAGRLAGSAGNYLARIPRRFKAHLLVALNTAVCVCYGVYPFLPLPGLLALAFAGSLAGVEPMPSAIAACRAMCPTRCAPASTVPPLSPRRWARAGGGLRLYL